jgi:hypothetical protein
MITGEDAVARDDVVDLGGFEAGPRRQRAQALREQGLRVNAVQGAVGAALAARCADGVENPGVDVELPSLRAFRVKSPRESYSRSPSTAIPLWENAFSNARSSPSS